MTRDEALKVARILDTADGGCSTCVRNLYDYALKDFPEHADVFTHPDHDDEDEP